MPVEDLVLIFEDLLRLKQSSENVSSSPRLQDFRFLFVYSGVAPHLWTLPYLVCFQLNVSFSGLIYSFAVFDVFAVPMKDNASMGAQVILQLYLDEMKRTALNDKKDHGYV